MRRFIGGSRGIVGTQPIRAYRGWQAIQSSSDAIYESLGCEVNSTSFSRYDSTVRAYYIENFGCRAAQADGSAIERQLATRGMRRVNAVSDADVVVLNTCTVTSAADSDARAAIRRTHRARPAAQILVTGCYAQRAPQEISGLEGVTWVVGNSHKSQIGEIVSQSFGAEAAGPAAMFGALSDTFSTKTETLASFSSTLADPFA